MTFTHAKVSIRFTVVGPKMPESGILLVGVFDDAIRAPALRPLYEAGGIEEVGAPLLQYRPHKEGDRAALLLECWVYGVHLHPGNTIDIFLSAIRSPSVLEDLKRRAARDGGTWGVDRILGPGYLGVPMTGEADFRMGVHAQKKRYRVVDTSSRITMTKGFAVSELRSAVVAEERR